MKIKKQQFYSWIPIGTWLFIGLIVIWVLVPIVWVVLSSFRSANTLISFSFDPKTFTVNNYLDLFSKTSFSVWIKNSLFLSGGSAFLTLLFAATAGYAFSRFSFAGRKSGLLTAIIIQMFPVSMAMVALFQMLLVLGQWTKGALGLNSLVTLIIIYAGGGIPFSAWLIKGYVDSIPKELEESAYLDGATAWQAYRFIVLPLLGPMLAVVFLLNFLVPYNEFLLPSVVLTGMDQYTIALGMRSFVSGQFATSWTLLTAASVVGSIPILIIFMCLQRFLVSGLTKGAVKG